MEPSAGPKESKHGDRETGRAGGKAAGHENTGRGALVLLVVAIGAAAAQEAPPAPEFAFASPL